MKDKELSFYMNVDVVKSSNNDEEWIFEGLASTSNLDLFGDVVYPESFQNSIEFFKSNGKIFYNHNYAKSGVPMEAQTPIGLPLDATIRDGGLYIKASLNKEHPLAQKIWKEFLTNPDPKYHNQIGLSIGAKALGSPRREYSHAHGKIVNFLPDLLLYEVSMTPTPVNADTKTWVSVIKSVMDEDNFAAEEIKEVTPDSVTFDTERGLMVVKSTITDESGNKVSVEQYIDTEDVKKAMDKDKKMKKDEGSLKPEDAFPAEETKEEEGVPEETTSEDEGNPFVADEESEDAHLDDDELDGDESDVRVGNDIDSASVAMLSDKIDTIQDAIISIANDIASLVSKEQGGAVEGTTTAPVNDVDTNVVKSITLEDIQKVIIDALKSMNTISVVQEDVIKKSVEQKAEIVDPKVVLSSGNVHEDSIILKSTYNGEDIKVDATVLKGLMDSYKQIRGSRSSDSIARGNILAKAETVLGITSNQFKTLVNNS